MTHTPITLRRSYINLAETLKTWDGKSHPREIWAALMAIPVTENRYREILDGAQAQNWLAAGDKESLTKGLAVSLEGMEDFNAERFLLHALAAANMPSRRRAFINLAEAVRTINDDHGFQGMLIAIAGLPMDETSRMDLLRTYLANTPAFEARPVHRENLAESLARMLSGLPKFDVARFIHHATSDSAADDDGESGKWSYNHNSPEDAMKTTIEGDSETVVL